jgi:hypothetical protein
MRMNYVKTGWKNLQRREPFGGIIPDDHIKTNVRNSNKFRKPPTEYLQAYQ